MAKIKSGVKSKILYLKVWGPYACFTRPEMKVERVSYDVMTPSAARGILEAILWKPAIKWNVLQIDVLNSIKWISVRRNEVGSKIPVGNLKSAMNNGEGHLGIKIEDDRQQRAGLFLKDVVYTIHAEFEMTERAGDQDNIIKFEEMFKRRAGRGQCFHRPYLGCREFNADFELLKKDEIPKPIEESRDLGWILYDICYGEGNNEPCFFRAAMEKGKIQIPEMKLEVKNRIKPIANNVERERSGFKKNTTQREKSAERKQEQREKAAKRKEKLAERKAKAAERKQAQREKLAERKAKLTARKKMQKEKVVERKAKLTARKQEQREKLAERKAKLTARKQAQREKAVERKAKLVERKAKAAERKKEQREKLAERKAKLTARKKIQREKAVERKAKLVEKKAMTKKNSRRKQSEVRV